MPGLLSIIFSSLTDDNGGCDHSSPANDTSPLNNLPPYASFTFHDVYYIDSVKDYRAAIVNVSVHHLVLIGLQWSLIIAYLTDTVSPCSFYDLHILSKNNRVANLTVFCDANCSGTAVGGQNKVNCYRANSG